MAFHDNQLTRLVAAAFRAVACSTTIILNRTASREIDAAIVSGRYPTRLLIAAIFYVIFFKFLF